jgi:endonuclease-8
VWRTADRLDRALSGGVLVRADFRVPRLATVDLRGARVLATVPRGKHLLTRVRAGDRELTVHTHLRMDGSWRVLRPGQRWPRPGHQARLVLATESAEAVGFLLGVVDLLPSAQEDRAVGHLGPDVLGEDWDAEEAGRRLAASPSRPVFEALLDQRNLAGLGTIWAAELCFRARVHPTRPVSATDPVALVAPAPAMLDPRGSRRPVLRVYRKKTCPRCLATIRVLPIGPPGRDRGAYHCPQCQPA